MATLCENKLRLYWRLSHLRKFFQQSSRGVTFFRKNAVTSATSTGREGELAGGGCSLCHGPPTYQRLSRRLMTSNATETRNWIYSADFKPDIDVAHIRKNAQLIAASIKHRKGTVDVSEVMAKLQLLQGIQAKVSQLQKDIKDLQSAEHDTYEKEEQLIEQNALLQEAESEFYQLAVAIPNSTHPDVPLSEDAEPVLIEEINRKRKFDFPMKGHVELGENLDILRLKNLGHVTGHRSYYLKGAGAMLEDALVRFTVDRLVHRHGFTVLKVPDVVKPVVFEGCGMRTKGLHTQVYRLSPAHQDSDYCLAGTAEVGIAGYFLNKTLEMSELPKRMCAVSRCFRAETAHSAEARGLYRVHQFTKVEMFSVVANETGKESEDMFWELVGIQRGLFKELGLHFQILDMPAHDLGAPAYRKFDIEAWMPHRNSYGEISSASNCTDFQSRRLKIKYRPEEQEVAKYAHTLNGTACAVPRMIIAILENFQQRDGSIHVPEPLQPYMDGMSLITQPASGLVHFTRL
ncbi:serine--tRNA ligase, mitochondrial-like [Diadema setosum]|uniref:serine--tRNA ligase, mitochondrial-like n=1 Tax=Diadema setosum TaxID=31175 RepID=UPI003B3A4C11